MSVSPEVARWMLDQRGITAATLDSWGIESAADTADFVYPYPGGAKKFRKGFEKILDDPESRRTWWDPVPSTGQVPFLGPDFHRGQTMFIVEGESDAMALWQNAPPEARPGIVSLSGLNAWKSSYVDEYFAEAKRVFVLLDHDDPYDNPAAADQNEKAWRKIKSDLGHKARKVVWPPGIKDVAEFFMTYDWAAMTVLLKKAAKPVQYYPRLDLTKPAPPTDWLWDGMLVRGEITVIAGYPGIGKSMLTMALAVAMAQGRDSFLGMSLKSSEGGVLYVDEENPSALVLQRLQAFGLTPEEAVKIDYLSQAGVALDLEPEKLLEEALDLNPALVILDSQAAVSPGTKENDADEMVAFFLQGIRPLARETNASVVLLHHTPHDDKGRPRGSVAILGSTDQALGMGHALDQRKNPTGNINLFPIKDRRSLGRVTFRINGQLEEGEPLSLTVADQEEAW